MSVHARHHMPLLAPQNDPHYPVPSPSSSPMSNGVATMNGAINQYPPSCPVSHARPSPSSPHMACPVAHAPPPPPGLRPARSLTITKSHPNGNAVNLEQNGEGACPYMLPNVAGDLNPCYSEFDEELLYTDLHERVSYLTRFLNFTEHDVEALNDFQPILLPMVDTLVDNVYHQLFKFDVTKQVFMPRKDGHEGRLLSDLHDLSLDAPQIELRKRTFSVYMRKLVTSDYDDFSTWQYFDHIGIMHTGQNELKHRKLMGKAPLFVDLMHLSLLLGWTLDVLTPIILSYTDYPLSRRIDIMRAFQKVIWIQNDLFTRHYAVRSTEVAGLKALRQSVNLSSQEDVRAELRSINTFQTRTTSTTSSGSLEHQKDMGPIEHQHHVPLREIKPKKSGGWFGFK